MSYHLANGVHTQVGASSHYLGSVPRLVAPTLGQIDKKALLKAAKAGVSSSAKSAFLTKSAYAASLANSSASKIRPLVPQASVVNGKVSVPTTSMWSDWNAMAADLVKPARPVIQALGLSDDLREKLVLRPLDALLDIFDPVEDAFGRAIDRVLAKKGNIQNFFGTNKNIKRVQDVDLKADKATQNFMKRFRTIEAFIVLFFTQPVDLAIECAVEGVDIVGDAVSAVGEAAQDFAEAAGKTAEGIVKAVSDAGAEVASWFGLGSFSGLGRYGAMGEVVTAATGAAAAGVTAAAGLTLESVVAMVISAVVTAVTTAVTALVSTGVKTGTTAVTEMITGKPLAPVSSKIQPGQFKIPTPSKTGAATAPQVQVQPPPVTPPSPTAANGGVSPVLVVGGFAALAFLFLRSR